MHSISAQENYNRAITFNYPDHLPYEEVLLNVEFEGDMMWMGEQGYDRWGVGWEYRLTEYFPMVADHPLKELADLDRFCAPEPVFRLKPATVAMLETLDRDAHVLMGFHPSILFERGWFLMGMEQLMVAMLRDPQRVKTLFRQIADYQIAIAEQYVQQDIDGVLVGDDYGTQQAMMMSPALWREFVKPEITRIIAAYRSAGKWVKFHSCGHVTEIVDDLIEIGVNIITPCQAKANDLAEWGERFGGRIVFECGIDTQHTMMRGTADQVRAEARLRMEQLGRDPRGGLIIWADENMPSPEENRRALQETLIEHGRYPLVTDKRKANE